MPEWSIGSVSKTEVPARVPGVRIPPSPPIATREAGDMNAEGRPQARLGQRSSAFVRDPRSGSAIEASPSGKARLAQSLPLRHRCPRSGRRRNPGHRGARSKRWPGLWHQRPRSGRSVEAFPLWDGPLQRAPPHSRNSSLSGLRWTIVLCSYAPKARTALLLHKTHRCHSSVVAQNHGISASRKA